MRGTAKSTAGRIRRLASGRQVVVLGWAMALCWLATPAQAAVYYIDQNATGTPINGLTWATAFRTIPTAVSGAKGEFWVAEGTYTHTAAMDLGTNAFYGGFTSAMTSRDQRDWTAHPTALDGQTVRQVAKKTVAGPATLDGFVVRNGGPTGNGGGVSISSSGQSTFNNCIFSNNTVSGKGGAIYLNSTDCLALFSNCNFVANTASDGGGAVRVESKANNNASFWDCTFSSNRTLNGKAGGAIGAGGGAHSFSRCKFEANHSVGVGGAISASAVLTFLDCEFLNNSAIGAGGVISQIGGTLVATDCDFVNNITSNTGGGGAITATIPATFSGCQFASNYSVGVGGAISASAVLTFDDCDFLNNCASNGAGGAISQSGGTLVATNCDFVNNTTSKSTGGAISASVPATFSGCNFLTNSSSSAGGAISETAAIEILNCTFRKNTTSTGTGGAINTTAQLTSSNCVFANNTAGTHGGAILAGAVGVNVYDSDFFMNTTMNGGGGAVARTSGSNTTNIYKNCAFVANAVTNGGNGGGGAIFEYLVANDTFINCTFFTNTTAHTTPDNAPGGAIRANAANTVLSITNCIFWGNSCSGAGQTISESASSATLNLSYSDVNTNAANFSLHAACTKNFGPGIIDVDPLFADATAPYDVHLKSTGGRWNPATSAWVQDAVQSPCIDAGDPASAYALEPANNGGRINLGRYGNTVEASLTSARIPGGTVIVIR